MSGQSNGAVGPLFPRTPLFIGGVIVCFVFYALAGAALVLAWPRSTVLLSEAVAQLGVGAFYYARTKNAKWAVILALALEIGWAAALVIH